MKEEVTEKKVEEMMFFLFCFVLALAVSAVWLLLSFLKSKHHTHNTNASHSVR